MSNSSLLNIFCKLFQIKAVEIVMENCRILLFQFYRPFEEEFEKNVEEDFEENFEEEFEEDFEEDFEKNFEEDFAVDLNLLV